MLTRFIWVLLQRVFGWRLETNIKRQDWWNSDQRTQINFLWCSWVTSFRRQGFLQATETAANHPRNKRVNATSPQGSGSQATYLLFFKFSVHDNATGTTGEDFVGVSSVKLWCKLTCFLISLIISPQVKTFSNSVPSSCESSVDTHFHVTSNRHLWTKYWYWWCFVTTKNTIPKWRVGARIYTYFLSLHITFQGHWACSLLLFILQCS